MSIEFVFERDLPADVDAIGVPVCSDDLDGGSDLVDMAFLASRGFDGRVGQTLAMPGDNGTTVIAVGVGPAADCTTDVLRDAGAALARDAWSHRRLATTLLDAGPEDGAARTDAAQAIVEGIRLGSYSYRANQRRPAVTSLHHVTVVGTGGKRVGAGVERGALVADAACWARDLINTPAGTMTPRAFTDAVIDLVERSSGLTVSVLDEVDLEAAGCGAILGVAAGSTEPARLVQISWEPPKPRGALALVGKGVTFDSGGLQIKTHAGMATMKSDMAGAAAVAAAMSVVPSLAPKARVVALLPLAENMTGGGAMRPGDVLTTRNGTTVEVQHTDAEGRLLLADALALATEEVPDAIVDIATLTGGAKAGLGTDIGALVGNDDGWIAQVSDAAARAGEPLWQLPLWQGYADRLESQVADVRSRGTDTFGSPIVGALFLERFVAGRPWAHLDIAGPGRADQPKGILTPGGTGFGVRTLVELIRTFRKP